MYICVIHFDFFIVNSGIFCHSLKMSFISPFFMHNFFWAVTKSIAIISDILCYFIVLWVRMEHSLCFFCFLLIYNLYFPIERKCTFFLLNLHTKNLCFKLLYKIGFCSLYYLLLIFWSERDFCITLKFVQCYSLPGSILFLFFFWLITFLDTREYVYCSCRKKFDLKNRIIILLHILINILRKKAN